ncbi:hypothetical protein BASA61_002986 [Batrachochytrium salamandrivorans]|nr:hypothetical protein BASA61_002986 [Batrachochytrium salamandrivorans]KAH9257432.1 hypothetical protein BASA81_004357 [Batrachochytrium salamandrivorans]KAH9267214.1 hypothetical protein BASA84_000756 [Batrachochytrium salamandrivorans]
MVQLTENLALSSTGARLALATSEHPKHPPSNILDGNIKTFWVSTGLFPQQLIVTLAAPALVSKIIISSMKVGHLSVDGSSADTPVDFTPISEHTIQDTENIIQTTSTDCKEEQPVRHLRLIINKGYGPIVSIHRLIIFMHDIS